MSAECKVLNPSNGGPGCACAGAHACPLVHREAVVEVYDHEGRYLGCMGAETWQSAIAAEARRRVRVGLDRHDQETA
jgi:hypothetical protein